MSQTKINIAIEYHKKRQFESAKRIYQELIISEKNNFFPLFLLGTLEMDLRNFDEAINLLNMSLNKNPSYKDTYLNLGSIYYELNNYKECIKYYELGKNNYHLNENNDDTHYKLCQNLARAYKNIGEIDKARDVYEEMYLKNESDLKIVFFLYELNALSLDKNLKKKIKNILKNKNSSKSNLLYGNLLLSKYAKNADMHSEEYRALLSFHNVIYEENKIRFENLNDFIFNKLAKINQYYDEKLEIRNDKKIRELTNPIFIISLPRSGSTLLEKIIIYNQKNLLSGEETEIFSTIGEDYYKNSNTPPNLQNISQIIIEQYKKKKLISDKHNISFTDKSIDNFYYLGWIKKIFPNAKFIHCIRDPKAIIVSILRNLFAESSWSHNIKDILSFMDNHHRLINYWQNAHGIEIYNVKYENLINNFDTETFNLLKFCNLKWTPDIVKFNSSLNFVSKTASNIQIRQPIYKTIDRSYESLASQFKNDLKKYSWSNYSF